MARRKLLTASARQSLFEIPTDTVSLEKHYAFGSDDLELITSRRSNANRFGLALHLALLRHPGQGWHDEEDLPEQLLDWIGQQLALPHSLISEYGSRPATRSSHRALAMAHLNLRPFSSEPFSQVLDIASRAAFDTDDGRIIMERLMSTSQKEALEKLVHYDPDYRKSPLAWLRAMLHSNSAASMHAVLERLAYVREFGLSPTLGGEIHPARMTKFAREGAASPAQFLSEFGERRRLASLAAQLVELNITLTDAAIAMFERLTGQLFSNSQRSQDKTYQASKSQIARLMRMFAGTLDGLAHARDTGEDPFAVLDKSLGWDRLMNVRPEVNAIADSSADLRGAINLLKDHNLTGKRKLPDEVPMPFPAKHWKGLILEDGKPVRRMYETAVISTLRDRLRAGDAWVEGSRDYRRFDTYLLPSSEAGNIMTNTGFQTDGATWLSERQELLNHRLDTIQTKLKKNQLEGVRLENGRLKITPHDPITPKAGEDLDRAIDAMMPRIRITELLWDVANRTGFLEAFTDLRSGRNHENPAAILASILAGATNLGLERMAQASKSVTHAQLSWASNWHLRPETYSEALSRIIDAHHELPFAKVWGDAESTSSDGQFFPSGRNAGEINAKYGPDPGLKIYSFLSGQYIDPSC